MKLIITLVFFIIFVISAAESASLVPSSFSANFEEVIYKAPVGKEAKSFGKMDYKYPGNIRYEITSPEPTIFVSNPEKSWFYRPPFIKGEMGEVTIQKSTKLPMSKVLDAIKNGLNDSKIFTTKYAGNDLLLTFSPSMQKESSMKVVTLSAGKDSKTVKTLKEFEKLQIEYVDGRKVTMKFLEMKENVPFDSSHFSFSVPEKTRVTTN